jgi:transposase
MLHRFDLTDEEWDLIEPLLPPQRSGKRGRPYSDHRRVVNGILWIDRTGAPWRDLPERYGPFTTCHERLVRWQEEGLWPKILAALMARKDADKALVWVHGSADATIVRAHQHAAGARHKKGERKRAARSASRRPAPSQPPPMRLKPKPSAAVVADSPRS